MSITYGEQHLSSANAAVKKRFFLEFILLLLIRIGLRVSYPFY